MTMILKCKICGGDIEAVEGAVIGTCQYCGSTMTLPRIESEKKARLFNRAHQYRLNCEFDKAYDAYRAIVDEDEQEAEAYWGMLMSEYGIEYVDDPKTGKKIPTCHRTHVQPVISASNYKLALQYAETENRFMYQDEAEIIDKIQKKIISISSKIKPYDVFICYKESEDTGERTEDSVLAQKIYDELESKGIRTFFSRISLENKLGTDYEAYIYSALNSARVMLMVTTSHEHCEAVWVKNEWSRFGGMMEESKDKVLIPVYQNMTPYELPDTFSRYQSQDMGKVGAIQDLVRGVQKILGREKSVSIDRRLNELLEKEMQREVKAKKSKRIRQSLLCIPFAFVVLVCGSGRLLTNTYFAFSYVELAERFPSIFMPFAVLTTVGIVMQMIGWILSFWKGLTNRIVKYLFSVGISFALVGGIYLGVNGFYPRIYMWIAIVAEFLLNVYINIIDIKMGRKKDIVLCATIPSVLMVTYLLLPMKGGQPLDNGRDALENQIKITAYYSNVRELNSVDSKKVGEVYKNQCYTILGTKESEEYLWYEIETTNGIHGYVADVNAEELTMFDDLDSDNYQKLIEYSHKLLQEGENSKALEILEGLNGMDNWTDGNDLSESIQQARYNIAISLMEVGNYYEAVDSFSAISNYQDAGKKIGECIENGIENASAGSHLYFGEYETDGNTSNGKERISWKVLDAQDDKLLLISDKILSVRCYDPSSKDMTWEESELRKWLNTDFMDSAFSNVEQQRIIPVVNTNPDNDDGRIGGYDTVDSIFILNVKEAENYFSSNTNRKAELSGAAKNKNNGWDVDGWWLRTPGFVEYFAAVVGNDGIIDKDGCDNNESSRYGVRPVLWISISGDVENNTSEAMAEAENRENQINEAKIAVVGTYRCDYDGGIVYLKVLSNGRCGFTFDDRELSDDSNFTDEIIYNFDTGKYLIHNFFGDLEASLFEDKITTKYMGDPRDEYPFYVGTFVRQ